jgi:benzoylformate decarboxylase
VVCLIGDGSSMYAIQALWSAARYEVPILVFVVNNGQYTILKSFGNLIGVGEGVPGLNLPGLDPLRIAEGLGCRGERVERPDELREAIERALDLDRPYVLDVRVDPTVPELMG